MSPRGRDVLYAGHMASSIQSFDSIIFENTGSRSLIGSAPTGPAVTITGAGDADALTTAVVNATLSVAAGGTRRLFDRATEGGFDLFQITPSADLELWWQAGTPDDDATAKADLTWCCLKLKAVNGSFRFTSDTTLTNSTPANGASDTADAATGISDAGILAARIQAIDVVNRGADAVTVTYSKLN